MQAAFEEGVVLAGGGHAMAAGLTVRRERLDDLRVFLDRKLAEQALLTPIEDSLEHRRRAGHLRCRPRPARRFRAALAPYGHGNPEPIFALPAVRVTGAAAMRGGHVRCSLAGEDGASIRAIAWRAGDTELGKQAAGR